MTAEIFTWQRYTKLKYNTNNSTVGKVAVPKN
jgi:hypothetical protein